VETVELPYYVCLVGAAALKLLSAAPELSALPLAPGGPPGHLPETEARYPI
jgi:hypothetical protein